MRELQSLCLDIAVHKLETEEDGSSRDLEVDLMADTGQRRTPSRPTYESFSRVEAEEGESAVAP
jgi:DNA-directed RNA polymerase subunit beta